ncbi:MAG: hypothetical protein AAF483_21330 [Planctomycetota bacterium]
MKRLILCATVVLGLGQFVCAQSSLPLPLQFEEAELPTVTRENPFDDLQRTISEPPPPPQQIIHGNPPFMLNQPTGITDPASIPAGQHHHRSSPIIDTMVSASGANMPNSSNAPIDWRQGQCCTPLYVAQILMQQECVDGIWNGYSEMRAAECAKQWRLLTCQKCCKCGGCFGVNCQPCNRYSNSCDTCTGCASRSAAVPAQPNHVTTATAEKQAGLSARISSSREAISGQFAKVANAVSEKIKPNK